MCPHVRNVAPVIRGAPTSKHGSRLSVLGMAILLTACQAYHANREAGMSVARLGTVFVGDRGRVARGSHKRSNKSYHTRLAAGAAVAMPGASIRGARNMRSPLATGARTTWAISVLGLTMSLKFLPSSSAILP